MKEIRRISGTKVRQTCITYEWFTCGDVEEYAELFEYIYDISNNGRNVNTDILEVIARNIKKYSGTAYNIAEIMFVLNKECCTTFFEE